MSITFILKQTNAFKWCTLNPEVLSNTLGLYKPFPPFFSLYFFQKVSKLYTNSINMSFDKNVYEVAFAAFLL